MNSDPIVAAIYLAVLIGVMACVYQAARIARWHLLFCDRCRVRRAIRANRRPPSSRVVEAIPEPTTRPLAPVDTAEHPPAVSTGPNPGGRRSSPHAPTARPQVRHG